MKIEVVGSTKPDFSIVQEDALRFSGMAAGICYMPHTLEALSEENPEKTMSRIRQCIQNGHHSVLEHVVFNLYLENIPKILAMILNNEKVYATSERSSRYTKIHLLTADGNLYHKWIPIFEEQIKKTYPKIPPLQATHLAYENARYLISVFSPTTSMIYTLSLRQLCYIIHWMKKFIVSPIKDIFSIKVKGVIRDFLHTGVLNTDMAFEDLAIEGVEDGAKNRSLSLFAPFKRHEEIGESYCVNYWGSFAYLAQAQRHRTLKYEFGLWKKKTKYYVPQIIVRDKSLSREWLSDIESLDTLFPQGRMVEINERGTLDDFILKCTERLCGRSQLETAMQTRFTLNYLSRFFEIAKPDLFDRLEPFTHGARCTFPNFKCRNPCMWGWKKALARTV